MRIMILMLCLIPFLGKGVVYDFKSYSIENGLPQSQVFSMYQDANAYMWIGTNGGGLARFDGNEFVKYSSNQGLYGITVTSTLLDQSGRLWVGTDVGLFYKEGKRFKTQKELGEVKNRAVEKLLMDSDGNVYILGPIGAVKYDGNEYSYLQGVSKNDVIVDAAVHPNGSLLLINQDSKIMEYRDNGTSDFSSVIGNTDLAFEHISVSSEGKIYLSNGRKVFEFQQELREIQMIAEGDDVAINTMFYNDAEKELWLGTDNGVYGLMNGEVHHFTESMGLLDNMVWSLAPDKEGNLWIGTDAGISVYIQSSFSLFTSNDGLSSSYVWALLKDGNRILVGTEDGLNEYVNGEFIELNYPELRECVVIDMLKDQQGYIWIGTDVKGVFRLSPDGELSKPELINQKVTRGDMFLEDVNGHIWIAAYEEGLFKWDGGSLVAYGEKQNVNSKGILSVKQDHLGRIWAASYGEGIFMKSNDHFERIDLGLDFNLPAIEMLPFDKKGMFIATYGQGIFYYDYTSKKAFNIDPESEMVEGGILSLKMHEGDLWAGTNSGIYQIEVHTATDPGEKLKFHFYDRSKGFLGMECNQAGLLSDDGKLYIGTFKGLVVYEEDKKNVTLTPAHLNVSLVEINQRDTLLLDRYELKPSENSIKVEFVGINFSTKSGVLYQYYLEGHDKDWLEPTKINQVRYSNLSSGNYILHVRSKAFLSDWSEEKQIAFIIYPPIYKTKGFLIVMTLLLAGGIALIFYVRERLHKSNQLELEEKVMERTIEIMNQNQLLSEANSQIKTKSDEIESSIAYASRIQRAVMSDVEKFKVNFEDSFVFLKPKEMVSGDFFWYYQDKNYHLVACCDCTGHGVPGAMMSVLGNGFLNQIVRELSDKKPHIILQRLNQMIHELLETDRDGGEVSDGMDVSIIGIDLDHMKVDIAMAQRTCIYRSGNDLIQLKGDKIPIGRDSRYEAEFSLKTIPLNEIDQIYLFSDGYVDQFGGPNGKKLMIRTFRKLLSELANSSMMQQRKRIKDQFEKWMGNLDQVDDVLVIGIDLKDFKSQ